MIKKFFILIILVAVIYLLHKQFFVADYTHKCVSISEAVDDILLSCGYTDTDVKSTYRRQVKKGNAIWIEFNKTLQKGFPPDGKEMRLLNALVKNNPDLSLERKKISDIEEGVYIYFKNKTIYILKFPSHHAISPVSPTPTRTHKVAIVIDDLGYKLPTEDFLSLGIPLTYAILPSERHSKDTAELLASRGIDYLIHFPMEPDNPFENPGKAAVLLNMNEKQIAEKFASAVRSVPGAFGISNHMGSAFSRSEEKMEIFLSLVKSKGFVYFDSHTTEKSVAKKVASRLGVPIVVNQFFLDNEDTPEAIEKEIKRLMAHTLKRPYTVAIGHIHKKNLIPALKKYIPEFKNSSVEFVLLRSLYTYDSSVR